jgi:hypothetical protein
MSILSSEYSNYLTYLYDYKKKIEFFEILFQKSYNYFKNTNYLNQDFSSIKQQFPKFPYFFNVIKDTSGINLFEIQNCSMDNTEHLLSILYGTDIIASKSTFDNIPNNIDDILLHINYQYSYLADPINYYNFGLYTTPHFTENLQNRNEFSNLFSKNQFDCGVDEHNEPINNGKLQQTTFILQHATYCLLNNFLTSRFDLYLVLYQQILYKQKEEDLNGIENTINIGKEDFIKSFNNFIKLNQVVTSEELTTIITKIIFNFDNINSSILSNIQTIIINKLLYNTSNTMVSCFANFLNKSVAYEPYLIIFSNIVSSLIAHLSATYTSDIFNKTDQHAILPELNSILNDSNLNAAINSVISVSDLDILWNQEHHNTSRNIIFSSIIEAMILENNAAKKYFDKMDELNIQNYMFLLFLYKFWPLKFLNTLQLIIQEYTQLVIKTTNAEDNLFIDDTTYIALLKKFIGESNNTIFGHYSDNTINYSELKTYLNEKFTLNNIQQELNDNNIVRFSCSIYYLQLIDSFIKSESFSQMVKELLYDIFIYLRDAGHISYNFDWYSKYETLNIYLKSFFQAKIFESGNDYLFHDITTNVQNLTEEIFDSENLNYSDSTELAFSFPITNNEVVIKEKFNTMLNDINIVNKMHNSAESFTLSAITKELFLGILSNYL